MSFTAAQIEKIEQAIIELASGKRAVRVTVRGRTVEYGQADLSQLRMLRDEMKTEASRAKGKRTYVLGVSRKGL